MNRKELQDRLMHVNRKGSIMTIAVDEENIVHMMVDSFIVIEANDKEATIMFRQVGYDIGPQYVKVFTFHDIVPDEVVDDEHDGDQWVVFDMKDEIGRPYHVEMIEKNLYPEEQESWLKWQRYRNKNKAMFDKMDRNSLADWPDALNNV